MTFSTSPWRNGALLLAAIAMLSCRTSGTATSATSAATPAAVPAPRQESAACTAVRPYLDSVHAAGRVPAFAIGIATGDGGSCAIAIGMADTARRVALTPSALLLTGSVGKTYVAAVAMQLIAEGKLALDAPITRYIGSEPWLARVANSAQITVRHLMTHTSGIVRYEFDPRFTADLRANPQKSWTPQERLVYLLDKPAPFAPGAGWEYSDTNYIVLGLIIERITGRALNDEIHRRLLAPLALAETRPSDSPNIRGLAQGYAGPRNELGGYDAALDANGRFVINPQFEWAGGGYASTPRDLSLWMKRYFEGRAYPDSLVRLATTPVEARGLGQGAGYGLGVIIRPSPLGITWGHSGFFPGYLTEARYWPDHKLAVTMQQNTSVGNALGRPQGQVVNEVARRVLGR